MTRPTLYLSNWSSHRTPGHHGPGRKFTIMAIPRRWERGEGRILPLTPDIDWMQRARAGLLSASAYRELYQTRVSNRTDIKPQHLWAALGYTSHTVLVSDGDTLCCACSRDKAAAGECHRVWAAEALARAGWRVILDGEDLEL